MAARKVFKDHVMKSATFRHAVIFRKESGVAINITDATVVDSILFTLYNKATGVHVGARQNQDVLGTPIADVYPGDNDHTLNVNGTLTYKATTGDTATAGTYVGRYVCTFDDSSLSRKSIHEFEFTIDPLTVVS